MNNLPLCAVTLNSEASKRWNDVASAAASHLIDSEEAFGLPDEMVIVQGDGSLLIFVDLPSGARLKVHAQSDEWAWRSTQELPSAKATHG
jgi:hypothetical protein